MNCEITQQDVIKNFCLASTLNFTKYFFKKQYNKKYIVGDHHKLITEKLDAVIRGEITRLIINIAPRYGKTELAVKSFIANGLGYNAEAKFIHLSYSDDLALDNSEAVKDLVNSEDYQAVFDNVRIKHGSNSKKKWYTTAGGGVYATAAGGQVTGFGAGQVQDEEDERAFAELNENCKEGYFGGALIIDDPIKPDDADSETVRERVNNRFDSTIVNRVNSRNTPIIIIMQRLHEHDLCGYVMEQYPGEWEVLSLPCIVVEENQKLEDGKALWEFKHTLNELLQMNKINPINFGRQYMQNPQPKAGLMYSEFKRYRELPIYKQLMRKSYTDTADTGKDFLCSIIYDETEIGCFVVDVVYTDEPMETTEPLTAKRHVINKVEFARIESNNGGRGFARKVEDNCRILKEYKTKFEWFHQTQNKEVRIFTHSAAVNNLVYFPYDWDLRWPLFYKHVTSHSKTAKNAHDDAPDTLTGMVEFFGKDFRQNLKVLSNFG